MNHPQLDQAREWAESTFDAVGNGFPVVRSAQDTAQFVKSLPDQIVDGRRLRQIIDFQGTSIADDARKDLESLLNPPLPTLADMTPEEREACQWMQAQTWHEVGIIVWMDELTEIAQLITRVNGVLERKFKDITPRPDLPRLEWPGSHAGTITAESVEDVQAGRVADFEPALPRPEDVPAGEPWIVQHEGLEWVGVRANDFRIPWSITNMDGLDYRDVDDAEITLVSRLVPEDKP